jgi:hypothetical protein
MKSASFLKFALLPLLVGVFIVALAGCGSSDNIAMTQGNWSFVATSNANSRQGNALSSSIYVGGNLTQTGSNLAGQMYIFNSDCFDFSQEADFTGKVDGNKITFTSPSIDGQVVTVTGTATSASELTGSYTVTGGECADTGTVTGNPVPSITGTWAGTLDFGDAKAHGAKGHAVKGNGVKGNGVPPSISIALTQAATASSDGTYALSGTVTYADSCSVNGTITSAFVAGQYIVIEANTDDGDGQFIYDDVLLDSPTTPANMTGTYDLTGDCGEDLEELTLTKQ